MTLSLRALVAEPSHAVGSPIPPCAGYAPCVRCRPLLLGLALAGVAACQKPPVAPPPVLVASTDARPPSDVAPPVKLVATPGEVMRYRVSIHGLELAEFVIAVGDRTALDGEDVLAVQATARTTKVAAWLRPEHDEYTSWIRRRDGRPVLFRSVEPESRQSKIVETVDTRFQGGTNSVQVSREDRDTFEEHQVLQYEGFDMLSFLMFLRAWEGEPGAQVALDITRGRYAWRNRTVVVGYDNLDTRTHGNVAVVRYDGEGVRINRDGKVDPTSDRRQFSMWISDDADRVPIRLVGRTDYGDVIMDLVAYEPGKRAAN